MDIVLIINWVKVKLGVWNNMKNKESVYLIIFREIMVVRCDFVNKVVIVVVIIMIVNMVL